MTVIDADGHVLESLETFSDEYLEAAYHSRRPQAVKQNGRSFWCIDDQLFPRFYGVTPHVIGTPTGGGGLKTNPKGKTVGSRASNLLLDTQARIAEMKEENIDIQVIYPTLFLIELTADPAFGTALCKSYNSWIADRCKPAKDVLKWVAAVNLADPEGSVAEMRRIRKELDPVGVMILGTAGDKLLNDPSVMPFWKTCEELDLAVSVHVGWSSPSLNRLTSNMLDSFMIPFNMTLLIGFQSVVAGGVLDACPKLRVGFLELGCEWVPFMASRLEHYVHLMRQKLPFVAVPKRDPADYLRGGQVYLTAETDEKLVPYVIDLMGEEHVLYASDIPHGDREFQTVNELRGRSDISDSAKRKILDDNPRRFYNF